VITLDVPTFVMLLKKTKSDEKVILNFNSYRNMNRFKLGHVKNNFYDQFKPEMDRVKAEFNRMYRRAMYISVTPGDPVKFRFKYTITSANQRKFDIANMLSIIDKFACDCLVKDGFLEDDNWEHLTEVVYAFGGVTGERTCNLEIEII
jgi:hypothetical protein